jgi:hypothetical protein
LAKKGALALAGTPAIPDAADFPKGIPSLPALAKVHISNIQEELTCKKKAPAAIEMLIQQKVALDQEVLATPRSLVQIEIDTFMGQQTRC